MKVKTWLSAWVLSFCISFGSVAALATAFRIPGASLLGLGIFCLLFCALCAWAYTTQNGHKLLLGILGAAVAYSLFAGELWQSMQAVVYRLSRYYHAAYNWGLPDVSLENQLWSPQSALCFLALLPGILISRTVCRRKELTLSLPLSLISLYPCFVVTDTLPDNWCFLLILAAALVLILTQSLRRLSHRQGNRITAFALIPAVLLSVFLMNGPPNNNHGKEHPLLQVLVQFLPSLNKGDNEGLGQDAFLSAPGMPQGNQTDLTDAGPQQGGNQQVMQIRSSYTGRLYLRYQSFDTYSGTQWSNTLVAEDPVLWPAEKELYALGTVTITTGQPYDGLFLPYYSRNIGYLQLENGKLPNTEKLSKYQISAGQQQITYPEKDPQLSPYLALPKDTREAALEILREQNLQTPEQIITYVKNSAKYSLDTEPMPVDNQDFALWFLKNGETGYCVHFATAATVLLRAAGYPARYVTGYAVTTRRNTTITVTQSMAHAWVEYADSKMGYFWRVLEPTPGTGDLDPDPQPTTQPTQPTETTQPPTETTQPPTTAPTQPSETLPPDTVGKPTTLPSTTPGTTGENPVDLSLLWTVLKYLGLLIAGAAVLWAQYTLRLRRQLKKQRTGSPNAQALARWQEIYRLGRLLHCQPPEALLDLAEKARFSQHSLTKEELFQLGQYLLQQKKAIQRLPAWKRFFLKLIWAI